jgi:hypothetical protein
METVRFCTGIGAGRRLPQVGRSRVQPVLHVGDETERRIRHDPVPLRLLTRLRVRLLTLVALFVRLSDDHRARIPQDYPHVGVAGEVCVRRFGEVVVAQHRLVDVHGAEHVGGVVNGTEGRRRVDGTLRLALQRRQQLAERSGLAAPRALLQLLREGHRLGVLRVLPLSVAVPAGVARSSQVRTGLGV